MAADATTPDLELEVDSVVLGGRTVVGTDRPGRRTRGLKLAGWYLLLGGISLVVLFPIWMTLVRALSTPIAYIDAGQPVTLVEPQWDVFQRAFTEGDLGQKFLITTVVTLIITAAQVGTSLLAAYAFVFLRFPLRGPIFALFMATLMLPIEVTLLVNAVTIRNLGWLDSFPGLTAPFLAAAFGTFLLRQGFLGIPMDLRDAAELDGLGHLGFLRKVAIPVTRPIIASFTLVAFLAAWNQYTWPRVVVTDQDWETVQIALKGLAARNIDQLNIGFAAAILAAVPILILLLAFQKHIVRGLTAGAVKG
jgi:sn-glycerol 3-phosphate transport system permease protein